MCPALTCMVEVMVGVEVAMVDMVVAWPGDITVGRGEATVLGISILILTGTGAGGAGQLGGYCDFCFGSSVVTTLVTRHSWHTDSD